MCLALALVSCATERGPQHFESAPLVESKMAIASSEPLVGEAVREVMAQGGNIADAVVAGSFVLSVVRQQSTGIGGEGFLIYYNKQRNITEAWDFREVAPRAAISDMYLRNGQFVPELSLNGPTAVAVPGLVAGLHEFHEKHGRLAWAALLEPAIRADEQGVPASAHLPKRRLDGLRF